MFLRRNRIKTTTAGIPHNRHNSQTIPVAFTDAVIRIEQALIHSFAGGSTDGNGTYAPPVQGKDGYLYGVVYTGGAHGAGGVYKCSKDGTTAVVRRMAEKDSRIRLIESEENRGPARARNVGFRAAKGDWIVIQDSDDAWAPGSLPSSAC